MTPVIIYGKPGCVNCDKAKMLCNIKLIDFIYYVVGQDITIDELIKVVGKKVSTLPQIFIMTDGLFEHIGGYEELREKLS